MTKKTKKLGVKTTKSAVFDDGSFDAKNEESSKGQECPPEPGSASKTATPVDDLDQICKTLDKLYLDLLVLMEFQMEHKVSLEKSMTAGELHISKARYIMGHKNVSTLQLPSENSFDISPSVVVEENPTDDEIIYGKSKLHLKIREFTKFDSKPDENVEELIPDPLNWFGLLVPRDLRAAQTKFRDAISAAVDCANNQIRIHQVCVNIKQLMELKKELLEKNEE